MKSTLIILLTLVTILITPPAFAVNRVLNLDGDGDYVEMADSESLNAINSQMTMEAWIKATVSPNTGIAIIFKGDKRTENLSNRSYCLQLNRNGFIQLTSASSAQGHNILYSPSGLIALNTWYHIAGVIDAKDSVMRILLNGVEVASREFGKDIHISALPLRIGESHEVGIQEHSPFAGQIDEVRIWNIARTQEEIQKTMFTTLSGKEPGLVGYWRFDGDGKIATDSSLNHSDGKLIGDAHLVEEQTPKESEFVMLSGNITDEAGKPIPKASIHLEQDDEQIAQAKTDTSGNYWIALFHPRGQYDFSATSDELGDWQLGVRLRGGEHRTLNLTLKKTISIEGTILMLNDITPHVAVPVQVLRGGEVIAGVLTDENGKYRFINLKPGQYHVRCYIPKEYVYYKKAGTTHALPLQVERGRAFKKIDFRFPPFKKGTWKHFDPSDGLASMAVRTIYQSPDGIMWFGTGSASWAVGSGVSRYDGEKFVNFTTKDGLAHNVVRSIYCDHDGIMWFATYGGVSRYDGKKFVTFTKEKGLASDAIYTIHGTPDGILWFGTKNGVSRYDGKEFKNFTTKDGLADNYVYAIHGTPDGVLWFGTSNGVSRYDGKEFKNFSPKDGLTSGGLYTIHSTPDGMLWFGTNGGVSRYDGKEFQNFTTKDGLAHNVVTGIHSDPDGVLWFGTRGGVSRYDGKGFVNFTYKDGLMDNAVEAIYLDADGTLWFSTRMGGVSQYDGRTFTNFTVDDGLAGNGVGPIHSAPDGTLWFGTDGGVSRYEKPSAARGFASIRPDFDTASPTQSGAASLRDGKDFVNLTTKDGLASNSVGVIHRDNDGKLWFGTGGYLTSGGGVSLFDPSAEQSGSKRFTNFTTKDGLAGNTVLDIHAAPDGALWFGTLGYSGGGVSRYNGERFTNLTAEIGLNVIIVQAIHSTPDGTLWIGTGYNGIFRYDGEELVNFTIKDGLISNCIFDIYGAQDGTLWFLTYNGISKYNGERFVNLTTEDGLAGNFVFTIYRSSDGLLWLSGEGGVSLYDGDTWTSLDRRDGLVNNTTGSIGQDSDGNFWFGTPNGLSRYRRSKTKPKVRILSVKTDKDYTEETYRGLSEQSAIPPITSGSRVTIGYSAIDFKTIPEKRQYRTRITKHEVRSTNQSETERNPYNPPAKAATFDWTPKKSGTYTFEVQAIDRDLNYSEPASVTLKVVPPWYLNGWIAFPSSGGIIALLIGFIVFGSRYYVQRREAQRLRDQMLEQEQEARKTLESQNIQLQEAKESAETAKEEAETANRAKSIFLANMSHEIRTPMNAVLGYAQILQRDPDMMPRQRDAVDTIENSGNHLLALINDVLDISKIEAGRLELQENDFDLKALIDGISAMFQLRCEREGLRWQVKGLDEDTLLVHGDEGKLRQVLINLLGNAVKFTEEGEVVLRISKSTEPRNGRMEGREGEEGWKEGDFTFHVSRFMFEVIDTGVGIPPEAQEKIFEPFQQSEEGAKKGGTGLGLTISQRYITLMGGELSLESEMGVGSNFFFTLTLPPAESDVLDQASRYSGVTHLAEGYDITALIADDTKVNRDVLSRMLSDLGVKIIEAEDGQQAVEMFRSHQPDIVFMDIRMPVMDGIEATRQLFDEFDCRGESPSRPKIVAISASALRHEEEEYFDAGFDDFIGKPFRFERLCECLANVLSVEYEYAETVSDESEETPEINLSKVNLPEELVLRLKEAAEIYDMTELNQCLDEIDSLGADEHQLAEYLRDLVRNFDMDEILRILSEIEHK